MTPKAKLITAVTAFAIAGAAFVPTVASARGERPTPPAFEELDMDGNGQINRADIAAYAAARFAAADTDGNGSLSVEEMQAQAEARASERATRGVTRMVNRLDTDGDGALSAQELEARGEGRRGGGDMAGRMLNRADTDGDGAVSEAEYTAALEKMGDRGDRHKKRGGDGERRKN